MLLIVWFKKELKEFVKKEIEPFCKIIQELDDSKLIIDSNIKELITNSFLLEKVCIHVVDFLDLKNIKKINFNNYLKSDESFKVKCSEKQICIDLGQNIKDSTNAEVSLDDPDKTFFVEKINNKYYCYLNIEGAENLLKRGYSTNNNEFVTADYCKAMIDYSGYNDNGVLLDAYSHEGYVIIECALKLLKVGPAYFNSKDYDFEINEPKVKPLTNKLLCYSDSMADLKFAKQNAKLSKTFKFIDFGFSTLNDIDYTLKEDNIDYFVSVLPKHLDIEKFFFQMDYVMKKKCVIVILTNQDITGKFEEFDFKIIDSIKCKNKSMIKLVRQ
jgi:23S rRNA G2445 N2-methylase RlmL